MTWIVSGVIKESSSPPIIRRKWKSASGLILIRALGKAGTRAGRIRRRSGISVLGRTESTDTEFLAARPRNSSHHFLIEISTKPEKEIGARYRFKLQGETVFDRKVSIFDGQGGEAGRAFALAESGSSGRAPVSRKLW